MQNVYFDLLGIYNTIINFLDFFINYSSKSTHAGEKWGNYGWVPFLPQDNVVSLLGSINIPPTQEKADALMLTKLEGTSYELFSAIEKYIEKFEGNQTTFDESVQAYSNGLYTLCALGLFALIDQSYITSQKKISNQKRKLANKEVSQKYDESINAQYFVIASAVKIITESLFKNGNDFSSENEGDGNRNFISHGMNKIIPDKIFCLKIFVLLYNTYVLFSSGVFSAEE